MKVFRYVDAPHRLAVEVLLIFLLPILLFKWGIIPLSLRLPVLACIALLVVYIVLRERWSWQDLGFTYITKRGLLLYAIATTTALVLLVLYAKLFPLYPNHTKEFYILLIITFIPISFFQELLYRGFLIHMLKKVYTDHTTIVLYNALLFTILHIIYPFPATALPLAFLGGLFFSVLYLRVQNIYLVTISHALLNFVALTLGFFVV